MWGAIMYRQLDRPLFDAYEQAFLAAISPLMADAVRRALLIGESADPEGPGAPGMIVLGPDRASRVAVARCRGVASRPAGRKLGGLTTAYCCARRRDAARSATGIVDPAEVAVARVLTRSGRWVVLHGVPLTATDTQRVAVIVEPAHPAVSLRC